MRCKILNSTSGIYANIPKTASIIILQWHN